MPLLEMDIEQALISPVKADTSFRQSDQGVIILNIRSQDHHTTVEAVWPTDIWNRGEIDIER
jgi:hypothetical protein